MYCSARSCDVKIDLVGASNQEWIKHTHNNPPAQPTTSILINGFTDIVVKIKKVHRSHVYTPLDQRWFHKSVLLKFLNRYAYGAATSCRSTLNYQIISKFSAILHQKSAFNKKVSLDIRWVIISFWIHYTVNFRSNTRKWSKERKLERKYVLQVQKIRE